MVVIVAVVVVAVVVVVVAAAAAATACQKSFYIRHTIVSSFLNHLVQLPGWLSKSAMIWMLARRIEVIFRRHLGANRKIDIMSTPER